MRSFKEIITEAKVSNKNFEKALDIFKRYLETKLSTTLYRFGGPKGTVPIANGVGVLYLYNNNKAIRFNYIGGSITSITLWRSYLLGAKGEYTIDLGGLNLLQSATKLLDIIINPVPGKYVTYALEESYITEAKRIPPADFYLLVKQSLLPTESIEAVLYSRIEEIATKAGVSIPTLIWKTQVPGTKGRNKRFDISKFVSFSPNELKDSKAAPTFNIVVSTTDKASTSEVSKDLDAKSEKMLEKVKKEIENPNVKKEAKDPDSKFGIMKNLVQLICRNSRKSLIIYGGPGLGKTYIVLQTLQEEGLERDKDYYVVKGKITTSVLYQDLFMLRDGKILVLDDTDNLWGDADAANILKAALDSYEERTISWFSGKTRNISKMSKEDRQDFYATLDDQLDSPEIDPSKLKFPSEFPYNGRIIFISNLPYEKFDTAVLTRSAKIDMSITPEQILARIEKLLPQLGDSSVSLDIKKEILGFIKSETRSGIISLPSMRTFVAAEDLYRSGLPNWKDLLSYV